MRIPRRATLLVLVLAPLSAANAASLSTSRSTESVGITVIIPPIAAAIAAQSAGAAGAWTVADSEHAFMIQLPQELTVGEQAEANIFYGNDMVFTTSLEGSDLVASTPIAGSSFHGLYRRSMMLTTQAASLTVKKSQPVTMLITGI